jgi:hypothetical protein
MPAELTCNIPISINALVRAFDYPRSPLRLAVGHVLHSPRNREKHIVFHRDSEQQIPDWIGQNAERRIPVTTQEIRDYCRSQFQTPIIRGWVNLFVLGYLEKIIRRETVPQDEQRLQVPQASLHIAVQNLKEYVQRWTTELVFNLDEAPISDWEDRKTKNIAVPATISGQTIDHEISRNVKHISAIPRVSTTEKSHILHIIPL